MKTSDIEYHAWPPPPPRGGQQVGWWDGGVLAVHRSTGIAIAIVDERSRMKNRAKATEMLMAILVRLGHVDATGNSPGILES